jgi:predicted enzyme related to lactoylglutathione lyase
MSSADVNGETGTKMPTPKVVDANLEVIVIAVGDVDRAKRFYESLGWRLDADVDSGQDMRLIQFTPPGSGCSVQFGKNLTSATPGSGQISYLVVSDIEATCNDLSSRGVEVSAVFHEGLLGGRFHDSGRVPGLKPDRGSYGSFASFSDPDGNLWLIQEVTTRLPGRIDPGETNYESASDLAEALRRAEHAHGEHEKRIGAADPNWPDWYAKYMVAERAGNELPT